MGIRLGQEMVIEGVGAGTAREAGRLVITHIAAKSMQNNFMYLSYHMV